MRGKREKVASGGLGELGGGGGGGNRVVSIFRVQTLLHSLTFSFSIFPSPSPSPKRRVHKLEHHWQKGSRVLGGKKHTRLVQNFWDPRFPSCFKTGFKIRPCISVLSQKRLLDLSSVVVSRVEGSDNSSICVCQEFVLLSLL